MADSKKYRMRISYDGTRYSGWQVQPNSESIQGIIEHALHTLLKTKIRLVGAGRTDAGVHALGQVAHFTTNAPLECQRMLYALNGTLPHDIRIQEIDPVLETFHAQYGALSKEYHYHLWLEKTMNPCFRLYRHHFHDSRFRLTWLKEALQEFIGTYDFSTFANVGGCVKNHVRTITRITLQPQEGGVRLEFEGNGFLYKMIRNIVGTLLEVSIGKKQIPDIALLLSAKDRRAAGPAAPAKGLFLVNINYGLSEISINDEKCENSLSMASERVFNSEGSK